jgi:hypothetical protein
MMLTRNAGIRRVERQNANTDHGGTKDTEGHEEKAEMQAHRWTNTGSGSDKAVHSESQILSVFICVNLWAVF